MNRPTTYLGVALAGMLFFAACGEDEPSTAATDPETSMTQPDESDPTTAESSRPRPILRRRRWIHPTRLGTIPVPVNPAPTTLRPSRR